jgi:terminase small subunit-like protein
MGRPSIYTEELADRVLAQIEAGHSLRQIEAMDGLPHRSTIMKWCRVQEGFAEQYARACGSRAELYAEEIIAIADDMSIGADHKRVQVDARKWTAAKLLPKKYGENVNVTGTLTLEQLVTASVKPAGEADT